MNVTSFITKNYENKRPFSRRQNEPKTNPIYGKTNPILSAIAFLPSIALAKEGAKVDQTQFTAKQTQFKPNFAKNEPNLVHHSLPALHSLGEGGGEGGSNPISNFALALLVLVIAAGTNGCGQKAWQASPERVKKLSENRPNVNYCEEKVPEYTLPDPLLTSDGTKVADADTWRTRQRPRILDLFRRYMYGRAPIERPANMNFKVFDVNSRSLSGRAIRKQVTVNFTGKRDEASMDILIYLPNKAKKPVPLFLILNFCGNQTIHPDPAIKLSQRWTRPWIPGVVKNRATGKSRGKRAQRFPVEMIIAGGYGLATIYYGDIDPDYDDGFKNGVHEVFDKLIDGKRADDAWGSIGAWAWGLSRAMDYIETDADIDRRRVIVLGHSRLGKTALWAGAQDERFAIVISNNSGSGGAALSRRCFGENVAQTYKWAGYWYCDNYKKYIGNENNMPFDQHMLIALIAPRPVYVASADMDLWADPRGEFLTCKHAETVYHLLGKKGLEVNRMPALDKPVQKGCIGYHIRSGEHNLTEYDWRQFINFADKHFKK